MRTGTLLTHSSLLQGKHQPRNPKGEPICSQCESHYGNIINTTRKLHEAVGYAAFKQLAEATLKAIRESGVDFNSEEHLMETLLAVGRRFIPGERIVTINVLAEAVSHYQALIQKSLGMQKAQALLEVLFGKQNVSVPINPLARLCVIADKPARR